MDRIGYQDNFRKTAGPAVMDLARRVASGFRTRRYLGDFDDWVQDAAAEVVEGVRGSPTRHPMPLETATRNWHAMAANCAVALAQRRRLSAVSLSEGAAKRYAEFADRTPLVGCGQTRRAEPRAVDPAGGYRPDAGIDDQQRRRARSALLAHLGGHVARMAAADRLVLAQLLGLRGAEPMAPDEVCWATGASPGFVANAVRRLAASVSRDRVALRLRRRDRAA
jgi:hypothetical protein